MMLGRSNQSTGEYDRGIKCTGEAEMYSMEIQRVAIRLELKYRRVPAVQRKIRYFDRRSPAVASKILQTSDFK